MKRCFALAISLGALCAALTGAQELKISSPSFQAGAQMPPKFTCKGENISPALAITGVPSGAKSLVLILDDPDAPGGLFTHWLVWNINPRTTNIAENSTPSGAEQGTNDFGKRGYAGPCPPGGTHRYYFHLFALDDTLALPAGVRRADVDKALRGYVIERGELMARSTHQ
jgi:Raf kinase inhibitor-like YbhB/YbcL family protein